MSEDCTTCRYWLKRPQQNGMVTMCRRFPPALSIIGIDPATRQPQSITAYPSVGPGDWCGEHQQKPAILQ